MPVLQITIRFRYLLNVRSKHRMFNTETLIDRAMLVVKLPAITIL